MYVAFDCVATYRIRHLLYSIYMKYICKYIHIFYTHTMLRCWGSRGQGFVLISSSSFSFVSSVHQCVSPSVRLSLRPVAVCRPERCSPAVVPYLFIYFFFLPFCLALTLITNDGALFSLAPSLALVPVLVPFAFVSVRVFCLQSCQCRRPLDCIECGSICIVKALARARLAGRQAGRQAGAAGAYSLAYT